MQSQENPILHSVATVEQIFAGGGELGALCRAHDWAATPLGPVDQWPQSLKTTAGIVTSQGIAQAICWGPDLVQIYNDAYRVILGDKHPSALGRGVLWSWSEIHDEIAPLFARVLQGETVYFEDLHLEVNRYGKPEDTWFTFSYSPVRIESGEIGAVLVNCFETTARVQAEQRTESLNRELEVERARLAEVFRQSPSFLAVLRGPDNVFELVNDAYQQLVGGGREILGKPLFEAMPETEGQGFDQYLQQVRETGEPMVIRDLPALLERTPGAELEERFVDITYLPLLEADGSHPAVIAHGADVTEQVHARRAAEAALAEARAANRAKSQFLANMSHEIRTPINAIIGYADLLEIAPEASLSEAQQRYVDRILASSEHLVGLVNEILDLSKIEAGGMRVDRRQVPLLLTVREALEMVTPAASAKGVAVIEESQEGPDPVCIGDPDRVRQILANLLSNAVKFTREGGRVTIRCRIHAETPEGAAMAGEGPWIGIHVDDTGIGIPADQQSRIFEPFIQVDGSNTREQGGTGLGLTICRKLARMMGGDVTVESQLGEGSRFTLWLPAPEGDGAKG